MRFSRSKSGTASPWTAPPGVGPHSERNNALGAQGWHVLRFNGQQIRESLADYCLPQIVQTVNRLGGLADDGTAQPTLAVSCDGIAQQMTLFEDNAAYNTEDE